MNGTPVEGVRVQLIRRLPTSQEYVKGTTLTDERGAFALWAPSPGDYSLSAYLAPLAFGEVRQRFVRWLPAMVFGVGPHDRHRSQALEEPSSQWDGR